MTRRACADLAEVRSAYVDGALPAEAREKLARHLLYCDGCRRDVAELRDVRDLLASQRADGEAPADLSARLLSIATREEPPTSGRARQSDDPLDRPPRRRPARALLVVGFSLSLFLASVAAVGYLAAPPNLAAVPDPVNAARLAFGSGLSELPLGTEAVAAALLPRSTSPVPTVPGAEASGPTSDVESATGRSLSADQAAATLADAAAASGAISYRGRQAFFSALGGAPVVATIDVQVVAGKGADFVARDAGGAVLLSRSVPASLALRVGDPDLVQLIQRRYVLSGRTGATVAGRPATVVTAGRSGMVAARWWIDDESRVPLRQQIFGLDGALLASYGFTSFALGSSEEASSHSAPHLGLGTTTTSISVSSAPRLSAEGWSCRSQLAGLDLVGVRGDHAHAPTSVHLLYTDGITSVGVFEQRGRLEPSAGMAFDEALRVYRPAGDEAVATWQSGGMVLTVVSHGSPALLADAVRALPHDPPLEPSTMDDIRAGWGEILHRSTS